jgi:hypothetical protein
VRICEGAAFSQGFEGEDASGNNQRLSDGSVTNGVGIAHRSMGNEIHTAGLAESAQKLTSSGTFEPRLEKTGLLGPLSGADNNNHAVESR